MPHEPSPFAYDTPSPPVSRSKGISSGMGCLLGGLAALAAVMLLICCGGGFWAVKMGLDVVTAEIEGQLRDHPLIEEKIGEVEDFEMDMTRSMAHEDDETFVYDVRGTKGSGQLTVRSITDEDGSEVIESATLRISSGETFELSIEPAEEAREEPAAEGTAEMADPKVAG